MYNDYTKIRSEAKFKTKYGTGLKTLTPKQTLQRLPIALAQIKAGNKIYNMKLDKLFLYCIKQKKLLKKVYSDIMKQ